MSTRPNSWLRWSPRHHDSRQLFQQALQDADTAWQALRKFRSSKSDFADCLIERIGHAWECEHTLTFDHAAARGTGMQLLAR